MSFFKMFINLVFLLLSVYCFDFSFCCPLNLLGALWWLFCYFSLNAGISDLNLYKDIMSHWLIGCGVLPYSRKIYLVHPSNFFLEYEHIWLLFLEFRWTSPLRHWQLASMIWQCGVLCCELIGMSWTHWTLGVVRCRWWFLLDSQIVKMFSKDLVMFSLFLVFIDVTTGYWERYLMSTSSLVLHGNGPFMSNAKVCQDVLGISLIFSCSQ